MQNYSVTQTANLVALAGLIATLANYFGLSIGSEEIQALLGAVLMSGGIIWSWYNRYKKGDTTLTGKRI